VKGENLQNEETGENKEQSLYANLRHFYEEKPFTDIVFKVEGKEIPAHKGFLVSRCSLFSKMFASKRRKFSFL